MRKILVGAAIVLAALYLWNASWLAPAPSGGELRLIAHRGVHQTFGREGLDNETCTAARIDPPRHDYLENTIRSMEAAFDAGADIVELDVHQTTDGQFAVFHDWTLDCRTDAFGETRSHSMPYLKRLDIGYGYTADGGATFPFRGQGKGQMPTLSEVLAALPEGRFLVNFKSNDENEAYLLATILGRNPAWRNAVWGVYGGEKPTRLTAEMVPDTQAWTRAGLTDCLMRYIALGWLDFIPEACRNTVVMVPVNFAPWLWGWPNRFLVRMRDAGSEVILIGPYGRGDPGTAGIDSLALLGKVPAGFDGYVWTNRIELVGPALGRGQLGN